MAVWLCFLPSGAVWTNFSLFNGSLDCFFFLTVYGPFYGVVMGDFVV